jgi:Arc/MetJ-type ribon-helix-helix transcriptional regulator
MDEDEQDEEDEKDEEDEEDEECTEEACCCSGEDEAVLHKLGKKGFMIKLAHGLEGRDNVVMTRLNDDDLKQIDALVEVEVFKSRSEAVAFFIKEGIQARKDLFQKVMSTVDQIRELKEQAKKSLSKE